MAWAKPSRSQAMSGGFGQAWGLRRLDPPKAKLKPGLSGQAGPEQHYWSLSKLLGNSLQVTAQLFPTCRFTDHVSEMGSCRWKHSSGWVEVSQSQACRFNEGMTSSRPVSARTTVEALRWVDLATGEFYSDTSASYSLLVGSWTSSILNKSTT